MTDSIPLTQESFNMKRFISGALVFFVSFSGISTGCSSLTSRTAWATAIGCGAGLALGTIADEAARKKEAKKRKNDILAIFKEKKQHNQGKIVGLASGCMIGLGTGVYLDLMYDDIEQKMKGKGIALEKVAGKDGETEELLVKMDGDISFATGSANLVGVAENNVNNVSEALAAYPETKVRIWGHSDGTGARAVNEKLSKQRADSVAKMMTTRYDISSSRIAETVGYANDRPLPGTSATGNVPQNRRVEIRIIPD